MKTYKHIPLLLFLCWIPINLMGMSNVNPPVDKVTLQNAELLISKLPKGDPWLKDPEGSQLAWSESYILEAFVNLYEATKDVKYLSEVAIRGKWMISHRDDVRGVVDGSGQSRPAWSVGGRYVAASRTLLSTSGEEILKIRSTTSADNNSTTVEVVRIGESSKFKLIVRNEVKKRYETFNDLNMTFTESYIKNAINDPMAPYTCSAGTYIDKKSNLIRIEEVNTKAKDVLASQMVRLTPIPLAFAGFLGVIYHPLLRFCEIVKNDPSLSDFLPDANLFIEAAETSYSDISTRLWRTGPSANEGYYLMCEKGESMPADNVGQPFNYLARHTCNQLALYRLTNKPAYLDRSTRMINLFFNRLIYDSAKDLYKWNYWYEPMTTTGWKPQDNISYNTMYYPGVARIEDLSHGGHDIAMVMAAYHMGIKFTKTHIKRFANTFLKNVITPDRMKITKLVDGSGDNQDYFSTIYQWFTLAEVDPEVAKAGKELYNNRTEETFPFTAKLLLYAASMPNTDGVLFVNKNAVGGNKGNSWSNAFTELADALKEAQINPYIKEIWVAKGTYKPLYSPRTGANFSDEGRDNAFLLVKDVKIYGGFDPDNGIIDLSHKRILPTSGKSIPLNATVLSGDIDNNNLLDNGNSYHVVISSGDVGTALLDGLVITGGCINSYGNIAVNSNSSPRHDGAGLYVVDSSPTLVNVLISGNSVFALPSIAQGGGLFTAYEFPVLTNVTVSGNTAAGEKASSESPLSIVKEFN